MPNAAPAVSPSLQLMNACPSVHKGPALSSWTPPSAHERLPQLMNEGGGGTFFPVTIVAASTLIGPRRVSTTT